MDGGETATFKQYFLTWKEGEDNPNVGFGRVYAPGSIAEW